MTKSDYANRGKLLKKIEWLLKYKRSTCTGWSFASTI